jgi:uncharacterized protein
MLYLDTSVLIAAMTPEVGTVRVLAWLAKQDSSALNISYWTVTEFSSALSVKTRTGQITPGLRANVTVEFARLAAETFVVNEVKSSHFIAAARFVDDMALTLRGPDALHLAIALGLGATLCTLDKKFAEAAVSVGAKVIVP